VAATAGLLVLMALAGCAGGQGFAGQGAQRVGGVHFTDAGGYLEFVARQREQQQRSKVGAGDTESKESLFEESLQLEVEGYAYHPNLLEFSLAGLFGLLQEQYDDVYAGRHRSSSDDGTVIEFDLNGHFFKKKAYPGTVFARRYQALEPRPFLPSIETTTTNFGLVWQYVSDKMPTSFQFTHTEVELDPLSSDEQEGSQTDTLARFETAYRFSDHNVLSFLYNRQSHEQQPFALEYDSDEATLSHRLDFGQGYRHRLDSELNFYSQRGTFDIERLRWRELLRFQHTDSLRTWYLFEATDRTQGSLSGVAPIEERSYYFAPTLEHQWYQSLVTQLTAYVQRQEFEPDFQIDRFGGQASFDYRKKNPLGSLQANYRARYSEEERTGGEIRNEVLDERHTFQDPEPVVLANLDADTGSIVVTAEDGLTFYTGGRDYRVQTVGDTIELERVPTGRILDGQTVLIDYTYSLGGGFTLTTVGQDFGIQQNFSFGLTPYYRLRWQDQTITPQSATGAVSEDITAHILGAEFKRGGLRLSAEFEDHDSTIIPFQAVRLSGDYTHRFKFGATGIVKARWSDFDYDPPNERQTTFFTLEGRWRHPLTKDLTVEAAALYRNVEDTLSGPDEGIDVDLSLEWLVRETEVRVTYEFGQIDDVFAENEYSALYVQVKRRF